MLNTVSTGFKESRYTSLNDFHIELRFLHLCARPSCKTDIIRQHYNKKRCIYKDLSIRFLDRYNIRETIRRVETQRCVFVSRRILNWAVSVLCTTVLLMETGYAQDFRVVRPIGPYSQGMAVEDIDMVEPGSLALSLTLNRADGILDAIDPPTGRRVSVIDTQYAMDVSLAWQHNDDLRLHLSIAASHIKGNTFGAFDGGGYEVGDTDFGVRWRLVNHKQMGLQLGLYTDLTVPTGNSEQLAGGGATNVQIGALLSQRFDDLTFQGMHFT